MSSQDAIATKADLRERNGHVARFRRIRRGRRLRGQPARQEQRRPKAAPEERRDERESGQRIAAGEGHRKRVLPPAAHGYQANGSVNYDTFSASLFGSTVVTLDVPPGSYFVTSSAEVQTVNAVTGNVQCRLINGVGGAGSSAVSRSQVARADTEVDNVTLTGLFDVTAGQALNLQCSKDVPGSSARIPEANIVAVRIGDVTGSP